MTELLNVEQLHTEFETASGNKPAVKGVSFKLEKGKTLVLLGESGCGKSITALSILRLLPMAARIRSGKVLLNGKNLFDLPEYEMRKVRGKKIGMIFQEPQSSLNPVMTCGEQIAESLVLHQGLKGKAQKEKIIELLNSVGIPEPERRMHEYPHQFSGGMKQRIMIAMALAGDPDLLIADEPSTALDVTIQAQVLELMRDLQKKHDMAILFITHDLGVAEQMADHVAVMYQGNIVEYAPAEEFFSNPKHDYSLQLFRSIPSRAKRDGEQREPIDTSKKPILKVENLKVHFPIRKGLFKRVVGHMKAVDGVSLEIRSGETVAIVGESGSGKTTMGKGILQLLQTTDGSVNYQGEELTTMSASAMRKKRNDVQIVFQDPFSSMNPRMMIKDIIEEGMLVHGIGNSEAERIEKIDELLVKVGLESEHKFRYPHEFSGGQRQRICIARALAVEPELIVCDEPTSALDVSVQSQILELLRQLQKDYQLAFLFITHNISVVEYLADFVVVMYQGKIVEQGSVEQVLYSPKHDYTKKLLSAVPKVSFSDTGS